VHASLGHLFEHRRESLGGMFHRWDPLSMGNSMCFNRIQLRSSANSQDNRRTEG
jgi:hypothetical protein